MKYIEYYPQVLREALEIQILSRIFDSYLGRLNEDTEALSREFYISTATEIGISIWEKALNIRPENPDIEARRLVIRSLLFKDRISLRTRLDILIGENKYSVIPNSPECYIYFYFLYELYGVKDIITDMLEKVLPLNLNYDMGFNGTFEFGDTEESNDEIKGFADAAGSIGGYLGLDY